jgi:hypothetical protein
VEEGDREEEPPDIGGLVDVQLPRPPDPVVAGPYSGTLSSFWVSILPTTWPDWLG